MGLESRVKGVWQVKCLNFLNVESNVMGSPGWMSVAQAGQLEANLASLT